MLVDATIIDVANRKRSEFLCVERNAANVDADVNANANAKAKNMIAAVNKVEILVVQDLMLAQHYQHC